MKQLNVKQIETDDRGNIYLVTANHVYRVKRINSERSSIYRMDTREFNAVHTHKLDVGELGDSYPVAF